MTIAKVIQSGSSQAIRLPDEFRLSVAEVYLTRTPEGFLVTSRDPWDAFFEGVEEISESFFETGRAQPAVEQRGWKE